MYIKSGYVSVVSCGDGPYIALRIAAPNAPDTAKTVYLTDDPAEMRIHINKLVNGLITINKEMEEKK